MRQVNDVLIVGAGIGGLAAAAAFAAQGAPTEVVEVKPDATAGLGVGINQPANALRALGSLGILNEMLAVGFRYDTELFYDWQGNFVVECPSRLGGPGIPANTAETLPGYLARMRTELPGQLSGVQSLLNAPA